MNIKDKLERELEEIRYHQKRQKGLLLQEDDIKILFALLKDNDQEMKPMLDIMETLVLKELNEDYLQAEKHMTDILKYYNLVENKDFLRSRHKFFFTESKKLVKKPFFGPDALEKVKTEIAIHNIFKKL